MIDNCFDVTEKIALVTGASGGLGEHFARTLAAHGARVALCARRTDNLTAIAADIESAGGKALAVAMDVSDETSVREALDAVEAGFGVPHILVNNAGIARTERFLDITPEAWQRTLDVNLTGVFRVGQAVARRMAASEQGGSIINIASLLAFVVQPTQAAYASTKAAVVHLTSSMARELGRNGIRVNAIAPGYFVSDMNRAFFESPAGAELAKQLFPRRTGDLRELDGPLLLLASQASSYMTGVTVQVDGGTRLAM
ncbi:MAG: SDR family NAD(P)-dependent oxidoreductase [Gammaproteobacteria bacterium]